MELILFERDGSIYALPADAVAQVAVDSPLKPLPFPSALVEGFVQVGGRVLVALDLTARLRRGSAPDFDPWNPLPETLEVRSAAGPFAVRIRRVLGRIPMNRIPLDVLTLGADPRDAPDAAGEPVIASFKWCGLRALLLDPEALRVTDPGPQRAPAAPRPQNAASAAPCAPAPPPLAPFRRPDAWPD